MVFLRKLLFPFAVLYGLIAQFRNYLYDAGLLKSHRFDIPVIAVGNLSVGGTGKTPMIEYLIALLSDNYRLATLSRGYKRNTSGFILADQNDSADTIGDEPFQFHLKFPLIDVAVDTSRSNGINQLLSKPIKPQVILLDDAFQHRKVKAGFYILLTSYDDLYCDDLMLPTGNLRELRSGASRADVIIVTKCPPDLTEKKQNKIRRRLKPLEHQELFFSFIKYDEWVYSENHKIRVDFVEDEPKVLLAGIAKPRPFFSYLRGDQDIMMKFRDHHHFSEADILDILQKAGNRKIITTEKDFVRLKGKLPPEQLFYLPIQTVFLGVKNGFDQTILDLAKFAAV